MNRIPTSGYELPDLYQRDLLELMVQGPHTLYLYWEITNRKRWLVSQHFGCDWGFMPKVLRIYDVTCVHFHGSNANCHFDIETTPEARSWYIHNVSSNTSYMADLGVYTLEKQFVPLLRSKTVITPRDFPAGYGEPILSTVPEARNGVNRNWRIMPRFHENFHIYEEYAK